MSIDINNIGEGKPIPEVNLWRAVVVQALKDSINFEEKPAKRTLWEDSSDAPKGTGKKSGKKSRRVQVCGEMMLDAVSWIWKSEDAPTVFENAGMNAEYIRKRLGFYIVVMAVSIVRGYHPKFKKVAGRGKVVWGKPSRAVMQTAKTFLDSDIGKEIKASCQMPESDKERRSILTKIMMLSRGEDSETEAGEREAV